MHLLPLAVVHILLHQGSLRLLGRIEVQQVVTRLTLHHAHDVVPAQSVRLKELRQMVCIYGIRDDSQPQRTSRHVLHAGAHQSFVIDPTGWEYFVAIKLLSAREMGLKLCDVFRRLEAKPIASAEVVVHVQQQRIDHCGSVVAKYKLDIPPGSELGKPSNVAPLASPCVVVLLLCRSTSTADLLAHAANSELESTGKDGTPHRAQRNRSMQHSKIDRSKLIYAQSTYAEEDRRVGLAPSLARGGNTVARHGSSTYGAD
jgi:hypothetical protein